MIQHYPAIVSAIHLVFTIVVALALALPLGVEAFTAFTLGMDLASVAVALKCLAVAIALIFQRMLFVLFVASMEAQLNAAESLKNIARQLNCNNWGGTVADDIASIEKKVRASHLKKVQSRRAQRAPRQGPPSDDNPPGASA